MPLTWTPCNYGGKRPWFVCPGVMNGSQCCRRVGKLYLGGKYFLCRHCYNLAYASQREDRATRLMHKAQQIRRRLGGHPGMIYPFPEKPKGMHWRTYEQLWRKAREAEHNSLLAMAQRLELLSGRMSKISKKATESDRPLALSKLLQP